METRGRPKYKPTDELRERVSILAGGGLSHEGIALALGIARQTLETYYAVELSIGAYSKRAVILAALYEKASKGDVSAAKMYMQMEPKSAAPPEEKQPPIGKKAQADTDAKTAHLGTSWENDLEMPSSVQ